MSENHVSTRDASLRIARNSAILGAGQVITLALGFGTTILVTDVLGAASYGLFIGAQRFILFFLVIAQFGLHPMLIRAVARQEDAGALLATVLTLRSGLCLAFAGVVALAAMTGDYLPGHHWVLAAFVVMEIAGAYAEIFMAVYEGREQMVRPTIVELLRSVTTFSGVAFVASVGGGLLEIVSVYLCARVFQLVGSLILRPPRLQLRVRKEWFSRLIGDATPFVAIAFADMALRSVDVMMLARFSSIPEASRYGAALNFVEVLFVLPSLVQRALLPAFSRLHVSGGAAEVAENTLVVSWGLLLPLSVGLALLADQALALYPSGEFASAASVMQVLAASLPFLGIKMVSAMLLTGSGRLWHIVGAYSVAVPVQVLVNWALIARYGAAGVALGTVLSQATAALILLVMARSLSLRLPVLALLRQASATLALAAVVLLTRDLFVLVPVFCGFLAYISVLLLICPSSSLERGLVREFVAWLRRR